MTAKNTSVRRFGTTLNLLQSWTRPMAPHGAMDSGAVRGSYSYRRTDFRTTTDTGIGKRDFTNLQSPEFRDASSNRFGVSENSQRRDFKHLAHGQKVHSTEGAQLTDETQVLLAGLRTSTVGLHTRLQGLEVIS